MKKYKLTLESEGSVILIGTFNTAQGAITMAKLIIENSINFLYNAEMTLERLLNKYWIKGDYPLIVTDDSDCKFASIEYAKEYAAKFIEEQCEHIDDIELYEI